MTLAFPKQQPGFTLIETLIALVIVVIVLGGSMAASRTIQANMLAGEDRVQMTALANEALDNVMLTRDALKQRRIALGDNNGLKVHASSADTAVSGAFVATQAALSNCSGGACPPVESGGPVVLSWCDDSGSCRDAQSAQVVSPVALSGQGGSACAADCTLANLLNKTAGSFGAAGDVVGVRRTAIGSGTNERRWMLDALAPLHQSGAASTVATNQGSDYTFYFRRVTVTRLGSCSGGGGGSCALDPLFHNDLQTTSAANATLRNATYKVDVVISNLADPRSSVRRTVILTDW